MNSDLEDTEPTKQPTPEPQVLAEVPEIPATVRTPQEIKRFLEFYKQYRISLPKPTNELTVKINQAFVACCKVANKFAESIRVGLVDPLNKQVKDHNAVWQPMVKGFEALGKEVDEAVTLYNWEQEQAAIKEQKRLQDEADREKLRLEQEAEKVRQEAEAKRAAGDEMGALKATSKAERLEMQAETVAPAITDQLPERKTDLGNGHTLSAGKVKMTWGLIGWNKEDKLYADDPLLKEVDFNWLRQFCIVDPVALNRYYNEGRQKLPRPFTEVPKVTSSRLTQRGGQP